MICYIFKLDKYFNKTDKYYHFFDGLFSYNKQNKDNTLIGLNIIPSSYRVERTRSVVKNNNIPILLDYFGYNKISKEMQKKYEALFAKIYYCCYYKSQNSFEYYLECLDEMLIERNFLYPIVVLFKTFIYANMEIEIKKCKEILREELEFLNSFYDTNYFTEDLHIIYIAMLYFYNSLSHKNKEMLSLIKQYSMTNPKLAWVCLNVRASREYTSKHPKEAITLFIQLIDEYKETNNMIRYFHMINNLASLYNIIEEYEYSLKYTSKVIGYLFSSTEYEKWITYILTHYFYSLLMLKRFDQIVEFVNIIIFDKKYLSDISATAYLISLTELKSELLHEEIDNNVYGYRCYKIVKNYYKDLSVEKLKELGDLPYPLGIYKFLLANRV